VVRGIGAARAEVVGETVGSAVKFVIGRNDVKIAINPAQQSTLAEALPALQLQWPALRHVEIVADAAVAPGGARLISGQGSVDATLDGMIDRIAADLLGDAAGPGTHDGPVGGAG
jgi:flagellar biosynthesis/type III secretory pathway protein FliH